LWTKFNVRIINTTIGGEDMEKVRRPAVAGQFYDGSESRLKQTIEESFLDDRGPRRLPKIAKGDKKIIGLVVPHAGYVYSGAIAAHSYNILANNDFADTFIILGPNHTGVGSAVAIMSEGAWQTPLGTVHINENLANLLLKDIIDKDDNAHMYEHSIEVQLPFLQYSAGSKEFNFVPLSMSMQDFETANEVGMIIAEAIKSLNENVVIIASTDFSHAGFNYMSMPPEGMRVDEYAQKQDNLAIDKILQMNPEGLINTVHKNNISMCGYGPVAAMLTASKILGASKAELLKYGTSYEVQPSSSCVGYGAITVY
jgi:AmmeMemoRadiSam system protein B